MVFAEQERLRKTVIEKFDQRSHEKCGDQRTRTGKQAGQGSDDDTEQVTADPDEFERKLSAVGDHNGDRVIYRDSQVGSHVQRRSETHDQHGDGQEQDPKSQRGRRRASVDRQTGKIHDISGQKHVDQSCRSHACSGDYQIQKQHDATEHHVVESIGRRFFKKMSPDSLGKALKRVHTEL